MSKISQDIKDMLRLRDVMSHYGLQFNQRGFAICPFHNERTASLSIKNERYTCFGCGATGDSISFVMQYFGLTFSQAITRINNDFGLGLIMAQNSSFRERNDHKLNLKMEKVYRDYVLKKWEHYDEMTDLYRILWRLSQRCQMEGLTEYLSDLEIWLDRVLEGKEVQSG